MEVIYVEIKTNYKFFKHKQTKKKKRRKTTDLGP